MIQRLKTAGISLLCAVTLLVSANSHTLFLRPHVFIISEQGETIVLLINGSFTKNEGKVIPSRIHEARISSPDGAMIELDHSSWSIDSNDVTTLATQLESEGTYVIGAGTKPNLARIEADEFSFYLRYEGLLDDIAAREELNESDVGAAERYSKFAKALLQVGEDRTGNFDVKLGHALEIVPLINPYQLEVGDRFRAQVLKNGDPLADALVYASNEHNYTLNDEGIHEELYQLRTNEDGEVEFEIRQSGHWYVRLIDLVRTGDSEHWYSEILVKLGADEPRIPYESLWATLTFEVR